MQRPYRAPGIGWILALAVLVFTALALVGIVNMTPKLELLDDRRRGLGDSPLGG